VSSLIGHIEWHRVGRCALQHARILANECRQAWCSVPERDCHLYDRHPARVPSLSSSVVQLLSALWALCQGHRPRHGIHDHCRHAWKLCCRNGSGMLHTNLHSFSIHKTHDGSRYRLWYNSTLSRRAILRLVTISVLRELIFNSRMRFVLFSLHTTSLDAALGYWYHQCHSCSMSPWRLDRMVLCSVPRRAPVKSTLCYNLEQHPHTTCLGSLLETSFLALSCKTRWSTINRTMPPKPLERTSSVLSLECHLFRWR